MRDGRCCHFHGFGLRVTHRSVGSEPEPFVARARIDRRRYFEAGYGQVAETILNDLTLNCWAEAGAAAAAGGVPPAWLIVPVTSIL